MAWRSPSATLVLKDVARSNRRKDVDAHTRRDRPRERFAESRYAALDRREKLGVEVTASVNT